MRQACLPKLAALLILLPGATGLAAPARHRPPAVRGLPALSGGPGEQALRQHRWPAAVTAFRQTLQRHPSDQAARLGLRQARFEQALARGEAAARGGQWDQAQRWFQQCLDDQPAEARAVTALRSAQRQLAQQRLRRRVQAQCLRDLPAGRWRRLRQEAARLDLAVPAPGGSSASGQAVLYALAALGQARFDLARGWIRAAPAGDQAALQTFARFLRFRWYWRSLAPLWGLIYAALLLVSLYLSAGQSRPQTQTAPPAAEPGTGAPE